ncbi:MAG: hypothetical protein V1653_01245 [bacterium]
MKDKIQLVMEETGCDEEQAKLILESTHNDVSKAIRIINSLLKNIVAIKGKFKCENINIYGLFLLISDIRQKTLVRAGALVTYNPGVYENDLGIHWHDFEKQLYALRLGEGSIQNLTQNLQQCLQTRLASDEDKNFFQYLRNLDTREIESILLAEIKTVTGDQAVVFNTALEQLNLAQFKELRKESEDDLSEPYYEKEKEKDSTITLKIELVLNSSRGIPSKDLRKGDDVLAKIIDLRDIAQYLSKLLGGKQQDEIIPLSVPVDNVELKEGRVIVKTRFSPGIMGKDVLAPEDKVELVKAKRPVLAFVKQHLIWIISAIILLTIAATYIIYK